ncbi:MAG: Serine--tRNA ligase [Pseudomonadota bacterium]|jgi:seryl-tRNA synthetase
MIDLNDLRARPEAYQRACEMKRLRFDVAAFLALDTDYRKAKTEFEGERAKQNAFNKELPKLQGAEKEAKLAEMKDLAAAMKERAEGLRLLEERWSREQLFIPSIPLESVPNGASDADNVERKRWGTIPEFSFKPLDHAELGKRLDIIDIERGVKVAGARSYFLKGDGARLHHAVMSLAMDLLNRKGYTVMDPPHIVPYRMMMATGYFPGGEESAYHLDDRDPDFHLIGTAEVPVASYHYDEILTAEELPKRYAGYSPCYRREAGAYGKDTHGLYRVHQFYKVEQVIICKNDVGESSRFHAELLGNAEELMQLLELPYRVVDVCTGDMGQGQVFKNDIEAWMPSRNGYGETHSCSTFHEFQARRLNTRYRTGEGKNIFCHTLNNTLIASPRALIPILENNQQNDGSVVIPRALRAYMGGQEVIVPRR